MIDADDMEAIAKATRIALEDSRHGLPTPLPGEDLTGSLLEAANLKSWRTFVRRAKLVDVCSSDGLATITPFKRVTAHGHYEPYAEGSRTCRVESADFGAAIMAAFDDAA